MSIINGGAVVDATLMTGKSVGIAIVVFFPIGWGIEGGNPLLVLFGMLMAMWWVFYMVANLIDIRIDEDANNT